jgi:hypothetical protein
VLGEVCSHTLAKLGETGLFSTEVCLLKPHKASNRLVAFLSEQLQLQLDESDCFTGSTVRLGLHGQCSCKDVVLVKIDGATGFEAGEILLHAKVQGQLFSLVSFWEPLSHDPARNTSDWKVKHNPSLIFTTDICSAVYYTMCNDDVAKILIPFSLKF